MKRCVAAIIVFLLPFLPIEGYGQGKNKAGHLFIIGGGSRSDSLMKQLVTTADLSAKDYIIILPMASAEPEAGFALIKQQLSKHTTAIVRNFNFAEASAASKSRVDSLAGARLIYILGGDQNRFMKTVLGTPVYDAIHKAYRNGATIAGTSAGAAVMSRYMITGQQLKDTVYRETFDKLWKDNIAFEEGLSLLPDVIIDQHFIRRSRYNRLLSALAEKPQFVCIGIDEGTAIIVTGDKATVAGDSQVIKFSNPKGNTNTARGLLKFENLHLGVFTAGDVIDLKR